LGRIPEATIDDIRSRVDIVDLVGRYVDLKKAGRNYKGLCPFHDEKTPSFNVNPDRQIFHCFGCGAGGNVLTFLMRHENLTFPEAARTLARELGLEIPESDGAEAGVSERIFAAIELAQRLYREALSAPEGRGAREYLEQRGLDRDAIARFGVGFAPDRWDAVASALARARIPAEIGEKAGLLAPGRRSSHYDRLRGRVTFPIADARGRTVGFGGRALVPGQEPKYLNTPETPVFRKREAFYGFPFALEPIRRGDRAIVCEGYFDRLALHRAGLDEGVATCGTSLTREHGRQLRRRTRQVVLLFDGDAAGASALERALEVLLPEGLRVRGAALPAGHDPDTFLSERGAEALRSLVDKAPEALELVMQRALEEGCATPSQKADAVARVAPLVALIPDPVERSSFASRLAMATAAEPAAVEAVVRGAARGRSAPRLDVAPARLPQRPEAIEERHLRLLVAVLLSRPGLATADVAQAIEEIVPDGSWKAITSHLLTACREGWLDAKGSLDLFRVEENLDEESRARLREVVVEDPLRDGETPPAEMLRDVLDWFARRRRKAENRDLTRRMQEPSADGHALLLEKQRLLEARRSERLARETTP
jgi:DNA primase